MVKKAKGEERREKREKRREKDDRDDYDYDYDYDDDEEEEEEEIKDKKYPKEEAKKEECAGGSKERDVKKKVELFQVRDEDRIIKQSYSAPTEREAIREEDGWC
ncbi:hypothetical protein HZH68_004373 [Vespula germanica]|uniref:Uncharacterized protein n=1 Tax=Vespula germanica TaxID=30212 RepID=A0A834KQ25_VESGE|nr:hypothetical protein HZH68_004373 [Vespula germanica]